MRSSKGFILVEVFLSLLVVSVMSVLISQWIALWL